MQNTIGWIIRCAALVALTALIVFLSEERDRMAQTKQKEMIDPLSCLNRADANEPIFVLLGRDSSAPAAIEKWIQDRIESGKNSELDAQIQEAHALILRMRQYRLNRIKRIAASYSDEQSRGRGQ